MGQGSVEQWGRTPVVWTGVAGPQSANFPSQVQTPDVQRTGAGSLAYLHMWGFPVIPLPGLYNAPQRMWINNGQKADVRYWGMSDESRDFDDPDKHDNPQYASERVRQYDVMGCVEVLAGDIVPTGVLYELCRYRVPTQSLGVIEETPTELRVSALNADGEEVFSYSDTNGQQPCRRELIHPDPLVTLPLTWNWMITQSDIPGFSSTEESSMLRGVLPSALEGEHLITPVPDLRFGNRILHSPSQQIYIDPRKRVRYWVLLKGPVGRFRVRAGARLTGYWQSGGRQGAALASALRRVL